MTYIKFVDGKGGIITDMNTDLLPEVGEYAQFAQGQQYLVTRVMVVYPPHDSLKAWMLVTVEPA